MGGKPVDFYIPETNTALMLLSPSHFCFDGETKNSKARIVERLVAGSDEKPQVKILNLRTFYWKNKDKMMEELVAQFSPNKA